MPLVRVGRGFICDACTRMIRQSRTYATVNAASKQDLPEIYDVVCVGGGPAGLSLLSALRMTIPPHKVDITADQANRVVEVYRAPQSRPRRVPRSRQDSKLEASAGPILQSSQFAHSYICGLS
jgi:hypothetical protein